jgi:hypothetical protein
MIRYPLVAFILLHLASVASAQQLPEGNLRPVVLTEERTQIWRTYDLNPDCTAAGDLAIKVAKPGKGHVEFEENLGFSTFPQQQFPQHYHCNTQQTFGTSVFYTSAPGFKGTDDLELEVTSARGASRKVKIRVTVK